MSLLEINIPAPTIVWDKFLATDVTVLNAHLGQLLINIARVVAPILKLILWTDGVFLEVHLVTLNVWSVLPIVLTAQFFIGVVHEVHEQRLLVWLLVIADCCLWIVVLVQLLRLTLKSLLWFRGELGDLRLTLRAVIVRVHVVKQVL